MENITTEFHVYGAVIEEDAAYYYCDGELVKVNDDVTMTGEGNKRSLGKLYAPQFTYRATGRRMAGRVGF